MRPGLLLLDEPTANLDPVGVDEVRDAVGRLVADRGTTLVVVEHRIDVWLPLVDRVIVLAAGGGIVADGPPAQRLHRARRGARRDWAPGCRGSATASYRALLPRRPATCSAGRTW